MQFESKDNRSIKVNGYNLWDRFNLTSLQVKGGEERKFGINRTLQFENGVYVGKQDENPPSLLLELAKVDFWNNPISFTDRELDELNRILFQKDICTLECDGLQFYGNFLQGDLVTFGRDNKGYISMPYQMCTPYAYTTKLISSLRISNEKITEIYNNDNVGQSLLIDIIIEKIGNGDITIENTTIKGNKLTLKGLKDKEVITIYGEELMEIQSSIEDKNVFNAMEGQFIKLRYGRNYLKINGNCLVQFLHQEKRILK